MTLDLQQNKPRLLWTAFKQIDKSENRIVLVEMLRHLNRQFEGRLLAGYRKEKIPIEIVGYQVEYFNARGRFPMNRIRGWWSQPRWISKLCNEAKPAIIFVSHEPSLRMLRFINKTASNIRAKVVFDIRTLPVGRNPRMRDKRLEQSLRFACKHFHGVTYITDEMRRYCVERYHLPNHASTIWTSGVDAETFTPAANFTSDDGPFRLIYHGGIIGVSRGLDRLIQSINLVSDLNVHLTLISSLREQAAIEWIDRLDLKNQISLMSTIPHHQVPAEIQKCHAGILPFPSYEGWNTSSPIKLFEYLSCGKPVIVTDIPAHRNVLGEKPFAFFATDSSPDALAVAIRKAYFARGTFAEIGSMAREQVLEKHTWAHQAKELGTFLKRVLSADKAVR